MLPKLSVICWHKSEIDDEEEEEEEEEEKERKRSKSLSEKEDVEIGSVQVNLLPTVLHMGRSHRRWVPISLQGEVTGEICCSLEYEPIGMIPQKRDLVALLGFGGLPYYHTLNLKPPPPQRTFQVKETYGDDVIVSYLSDENWQITLCVHRNLLTVVCRPTFMLTARQQLNQLQNSSAVVWLENKVWQKVPVRQRYQCKEIEQFARKTAVHLSAKTSKVFRQLMYRGVTSGFKEVRQSWPQLKRQIQQDFQQINWSPSITEKMNSNQPTNSSSNSSKDIPEELICPITGCQMIDPVVAADGHSYERSAIVTWLLNHNTSPMTGARMTTDQVYPNYTLKKLSQELQQKEHSVTEPTSCDSQDMSHSILQEFHKDEEKENVFETQDVF